MDIERLRGLSPLNKKRLNIFIDLVKSQVELGGYDFLAGIKMPLAALERNGMTKTDAHNLCAFINKVVGQKIITDPIKEALDGDPVSYADIVTSDIDAKFQESKIKEILRTSYSFRRISYEDTKNFLILELSLKAREILESIQNELNEPELDKATKKKLFILEKLKEEWDLLPKKIEYKNFWVSSPKWSKWMREVGIDDHPQFTNLLLSLEEEGLIVAHKFIDESR